MTTWESSHKHFTRIWVIIHCKSWNKWSKTSRICYIRMTYSLRWITSMIITFTSSYTNRCTYYLNEHDKQKIYKKTGMFDKIQLKDKMIDYWKNE